MSQFHTATTVSNYYSIQHTIAVKQVLFNSYTQFFDHNGDMTISAAKRRSKPKITLVNFAWIWQLTIFVCILSTCRSKIVRVRLFLHVYNFPGKGHIENLQWGRAARTATKFFYKSDAKRHFLSLFEPSVIKIGREVRPTHGRNNENKLTIKVRKPYISPMCRTAPSGRNSTKLCIFGDVADVINCIQFQFHRWRGFKLHIDRNSDAHTGKRSRP